MYERCISPSAINAGGAIYDDINNIIYAFTQPYHPPCDSFMHTSIDYGQSWSTSKIFIKSNNHVDLHFSSKGIKLNSEKYYGRLIRPARIYDGINSYNTSIYSDNAINWYKSSNFPESGTGEGSLVELSDGTLIYSSRRHHYGNVNENSPNRLLAKSYDGGESWVNMYVGEGLYDGPRYRNHALPKGPTFQGHYGINGGLIKFELNGVEYLMHTGVYDSNYDWLRKGLVLFLSKDKGKNWTRSLPLHEGPCAYSTIDLNYNDTHPYESKIYILFEGGFSKEYEGGIIKCLTIKKALDLFTNEKK